MQRIAQDWLVLTVLTAGGGFQVGIVTALQFLPILLFSPWAGVVADRVDRRRLIQAAQVAIASLGLILGILILTNTVELWMVYILAFLGGTVAAFDNPVRNAFISELVPTWILPNAIALNSTAFNTARLIGPALSGVIIDLVGIGWVFIVNAGLFAIPVFTLAAMRKGELIKPAKVPREKGQIVEGLRYVKQRKDLILLLIIVGMVSTFGINFQVTSAMMATDVYHKPAGAFGLMSTAFAVGAVIGSLVIAKNNNPRLRLIVIAALLFGVALGFLSLAPTYGWFLLIAIPTGLVSMTFIASANAAVQISTAPEFRGRVMALYSMIFLGATPIGSPLVGWIGEEFGARWSMGVGAILTIATAVAAGLWGVLVLKVRLRLEGKGRVPRIVIVAPPMGQVRRQQPKQEPLKGPTVRRRAKPEEPEQNSIIEEDQDLFDEKG